MVCSAEASRLASFKFETDPLDCYIDGEFLKAKGTTLGADDGIGVAACMALLEDKTAVHGPLECLFTMDEETTMSGAENLAPAPFLQSKILINIDSEEEYAICIGCAGGFETAIDMPVHREAADPNSEMLEVKLHGLVGGHTGIDIHRNRANAIRLLGILLAEAELNNVLRLVSFGAGTALNTIPRSATAVVSIPSNRVAMFKEHTQLVLAALRADNKTVEPTILVDIGPAPAEDAAREPVTRADTVRLLDVVRTIPHGVLRMSPELPSEVETSISFSRILLRNDSVKFELFCRSSSEYQMQKVYSDVLAFARLFGVKQSLYSHPLQRSGVEVMLNAFPAWHPEPASRTLKVVREASERLFKRAPKVYSVHAGLECGFILGRYPGMDCVSIGPEIHGAHTPEERLLIPSVSRFYSLLKESLKELAQLK